MPSTDARALAAAGPAGRLCYDDALPVTAA
jgi:hypothetical protein